MSNDGKKNLTAADDAAMRTVDMSAGIRFADLRNGDVIGIVTENHRYDLAIVDLREAKVRIVGKGTAFFAAPATVTLHGSSLGGTRACLSGWIGLGHRLLL
ncbi:MAG: hypothetical protein AAB692_03600, partial [Patescibacteria group bacterium]